MDNIYFIIKAMEQLGESVNECNLNPSKNAIKLAKEIEERYIQKEKDKLIKEFADRLQKYVYKEIVGGEASILLKERYKVKEKIAYKVLHGSDEEKKKAKELLQKEAKIVGTTVDNYANIILNMAKLFRYDEQELIMKIEAIRIAAKQYPYDVAAKEIKIIDAMIENSTVEDVLKYIEKKLIKID